MRGLRGAARRKSGVPAREAAAQSRRPAREAIPCPVASLIGCSSERCWSSRLLTVRRRSAPRRRCRRNCSRSATSIASSSRSTPPTHGDTLKAAEAMAARLKAAGFPAADIRVISTGPRKGNLVARLRGTGARKPILLLAHIDVVPAGRRLAARSVQAHRGRRLFPRPRRHRRQGDGGDIRRQPDRISPRRLQARARHHRRAHHRRGARALAAQRRQMDSGERARADRRRVRAQRRRRRRAAQRPAVPACGAARRRRSTRPMCWR